MAPPLPLWWLMCSARAGAQCHLGPRGGWGPAPEQRCWGGVAVPPQGRPLRGRGPAWGFLCHPGGLCRGPWNFCGRRGLVAQETAPLGHQGAPAKSPFCQAWGVGCQGTRCVATAGAQTSGAQPLPPRWLTLAPRCAQAVACGRLHRCLRQRVLAGLPPGPGGIWVADARGMARGSRGALASHGGQV